MSLLLAVVVSIAAQASPVELKLGQVLTQSCKIAKAEYLIPTNEKLKDDEEPKVAAITIRGDNVTVDFNGATLAGTPQSVEPDQRKGIGLSIQGKNVTIKNARVRGYKVGVIARNSPGLKVLDCDFSYNWKQHLASTLEKEDLNDWMSFHHNEKDEWLRYGAGIYLRGCDGFEVKNTTITGGQCGLMLMESNKGRAWNNNFSFLSAIGVGLYKSSGNEIMHNRIDWCVRGYSHGVYNRGQDSAGILIYEQSNDNTFAYNSVTHGGDGFFLWAGQTTMDTGVGGCNGNMVYGNDFSHAPTNGIEATFSSNSFLNNLVLECWHGVWGGYSFDTRINRNTFGLNAVSVAIEHGQDIEIRDNVFARDSEGIRLWRNASQDPNWGYPKHHDTRSRDYKIVDNHFSDETFNVFNFKGTTGIHVENNVFTKNNHIFVVDGPQEGLVINGNQFYAMREEPLQGSAVSNNWATTGPGAGAPLPATMQQSGNAVPGWVDPAPYLQRFKTDWNPFSGYLDLPTPGANHLVDKAPKKLEGGKVPFIKDGTLRGRRYILVDQWGPYDFKYPVIWPREEVKLKLAQDRTNQAQRPDDVGPTTNQPLGPTRRFEILGPPGLWRVVNTEGVQRLSTKGGKVPGHVDVTLPPGKAGMTRIELEYEGDPTTDYKGVTRPFGTPIRFSYEKFFAPIDWTVKFFKYDPAKQEPRTQPDAYRNLITAGTPITTESTDKLDYSGYGAFVPGVPATHFTTVADGIFTIPKGNYTLEVTTDDGVRVWVDGKLVIDQWKYQGPTTYPVDLALEGRHRIHIEHFQIDGYAALRVGLKPAKR